MVRPNEHPLWDKVTIQFMTDESDQSGDDTIVRHQLPWRSDSKFAATSVTFKYTSISVLNAFIAKLDERHEKNRGSCWVEGKRRATGSPSKRPPPEGCPPAFVKTVLLPALEVPAAAAEAEIEQDDSDFNPNDF